jgi:hypothetical protein
MATQRRKAGAITGSPTTVGMKPQTSVSPKDKLFLIPESAADAACRDPGPAGFDFSEEEAERLLTSYCVFWRCLLKKAPPRCWSERGS